MTDTNRASAGARAGFTLIELLIVVVLIGILATIAAVRYDRVREAAWRESLRSDLQSLIKHQELHYMSNNSYGMLGDLVQFEWSAGSLITVNYAAADGWSATATHAAMPAFNCGIFVGSADPTGGAPATIAGTVVCEES